MSSGNNNVMNALNSWLDIYMYIVHVYYYGCNMTAFFEILVSFKFRSGRVRFANVTENKIVCATIIKPVCSGVCRCTYCCKITEMPNWVVTAIHCFTVGPITERECIGHERKARFEYSTLGEVKSTIFCSPPHMAALYL